MGSLNVHIIAFLFAIITGVLGGWQIHRLAWKVDLISQMQNNYHLPPLTELKKLDEFRRVNLAGKWIHQPLFLQYKIHKGEIGCHLILPFQTNNDLILINLGWQKSCKKIEIRPPKMAQGILRKFLNSPEGTPSNKPSSEYYYLNETDMKNIFNLTSNYYIDTINQIPILPNNHLIYALTWIILSFLFISISLFLFFHKRA